MNLNQYRSNHYSQFGEDGVIEEICRRLGLKSGWFVEFGAWDGIHLSNSHHLLAHKGWQGVLIEGNSARYPDLLKTSEAFPGKIYPICAMVGFENESKLDNLLTKTPLPHDFDLLSIDIDSYDLQVWQAVELYRPKIVIIECNCSIPPGVISVHNPPHSTGASFSALIDLARRKGYQLVCHTGNCIFVLNELIPALDLDPELLKSPEKLFDFSRCRKERFLNLLRKLLPDGLLKALFRLRTRHR